VGEGYGYYLRANTEGNAAGGFQYAGRYGRYTVEGAVDSGGSAVRASVTGGVAWVRDTVLFAQPIEQSFAVVKVGDLDGVRVLQSNQDVGVTRNGELALSQIPSLTGVQVSIDPLSVPLDRAVDTTTKQVVALPRTGVVIDFTATRERNAIVRLQLPSGEPVPLGATVVIDGRPDVFAVGYDGEIYLTRLAETQSLTVRFNGSRCRLVFNLDPNLGANADAGTLRCTAVATAPANGEKR
jgi:outer membrane usher protein